MEWRDMVMTPGACIGRVGGDMMAEAKQAIIILPPNVTTRESIILATIKLLTSFTKP